MIMLTPAKAVSALIYQQMYVSSQAKPF